MNEKTSALLSAGLPFATLAITLAAFCSGAPAKLAHLRAERPLMVENDLRDEPEMFPVQPNAFTWRGFNALTVRTAIALK